MNCGYILTPTIISHISTLPACVSPDQPWPLIAPALWPLVSTMPPASFGDSSHCIPVLFVIPKVFKYTPDDPCMVCLPTSLHVVNFHGKCRYIYHTWINWENILQTLFITIRDGPFSKACSSPASRIDLGQNPCINNQPEITKSSAS